MPNWLDIWNNDSHTSSKKNMFEIVEKYLITPPKKILDIGCGLAKESELFQKKHQSFLYLLDGEFSKSNGKNRQVGYGNVENFNFYNKIDDLKESWNSRNLDYTFVDANNIVIDDNVTFDLIYSSESCGFHYPADTYKDLIIKHSNDNTKIIFDIRNRYVSTQKIKIINTLYQSKKFIKAEIKFL